MALWDTCSDSRFGPATTQLRIQRPPPPPSTLYYLPDCAKSYEGPGAGCGANICFTAPCMLHGIYEQIQNIILHFYFSLIQKASFRGRVPTK